MKKIITVLGARPQFIKASVVSREIAQDSSLSEVIVHTGQHFDANMSENFFSELAIATPKYNLGIHSGMHGAMTGQMLSSIESILVEEKPDAILVYGDTNSTLAGALAGAKMHIPIAHIESGLRSFNMRMPEELNRILTDRISTWLFTPTCAAVNNLIKEGINEKKIINVGDVMYDVALTFGENVKSDNGVLGSHLLQPRNYLLVTAHRAENTDDLDRLRVVVETLELLVKKMSVIWPLHPRTRAALQQGDLLTRLYSSGVNVIAPVGYLEMVQLEKYAAVIATDSGGVQKEAYFYQVPCVTLRDETEWVELVDAGWNHLAPLTSPDLVSEVIMQAIGTRGRQVNLYGSGDAAVRIVSRLRADLDCL